MVKRNPHFIKLQGGYLFPEIAKRKKEFILQNPTASLISLGIGDTTQPIPLSITAALVEKAKALGTVTGYSGYGFEQGELTLREQVAHQLYPSLVQPHEIFISDGAKCDIGRLQLLFGNQVRIAVQDPSYPVYIDTSVMMGQTRKFDSYTKQYEGITYMSCHEENQFFPDLNTLEPVDLIYFCSPNNPTGAAATHQQLQQLVEYAQTHHAIIIYDAAYACYIQDPCLPRSIYEIPNARKVAIEVNSFSKMVGFTGVRLGWTIIPDELLYANGESVQSDWNRIHTTFFNGASNIAQAGGLAALQVEGKETIRELTHFYLENAALLRTAFMELGYEVYGGINAPYVWVKFPQKTSWQAFDLLLKKAYLLSTPGSGFGPAGEGFLRFSAFAHRIDIQEAVRRIYQHLNHC